MALETYNRHIPPGRYSNSWSQTLYIDGRPINTRKVELLDHRRTVYRLELEPNSLRYSIPPHLNTIIVKRQKCGWEDCFQDERKAYDRLEKLQGCLIPTLYGQGTFNGYPALILSDEAGLTLYDLAFDLHKDIDTDTLEVLLERVFNTLTEHGAVYWDQRIDNFLFNNEDGKITVLDLEAVRFPEQFVECDYLVNEGGASTLLDEIKALRNTLSKPIQIGFWSAYCREGTALNNI